MNWDLDCLKILNSLSVLIMETSSDTGVYSDYGGLNLVLKQVWMLVFMAPNVGLVCELESLLLENSEFVVHL